MYYTSNKSRYIAQTNIKIAFPSLSEDKSKKLLINTFKHSGIITSEFFRQKRIDLKKSGQNRFSDSYQKLCYQPSGQAS